MFRNAALIFIVFTLAVSARPCLASPPVPPSKAERVNSLPNQLKSHKSEKKNLEQQAKKIESELETTKGDLVSISRSIQKNEQAMENLEERISGLKDEKEELEREMLRDRQSIARLVLALERIRRTPPEILVLRPDTPLKTAQSALLLKKIIPALHEQSESLRQKLEELQNVTVSLQDKQKKAKETAGTLKQEHKDLTALVSKKEQLYASTNKDLKAEEENVRRISAQAESLQDLVARLDKEKQRKIQKDKKDLNLAHMKLPSFSGGAQLPLTGYIRTRYNEPDSFGAPSKGIKIEGRPGALVVAPMGGVVRFAGPFKNYGNMVIIEHQKGYHSLIAGLEKIDTVVGHSVTTGEPVGTLDRDKSETKPALYYELRYNGQPVDPARKFAELG